MRTAAQHRVAGTSGRLQTASAAPRTGRHERRPTLDDALETRRRASPRWRDEAAEAAGAEAQSSRGEVVDMVSGQEGVLQGLCSEEVG